MDVTTGAAAGECKHQKRCSCKHPNRLAGGRYISGASPDAKVSKMEQSDSPLLEVRGLTKSFGRLTALASVSFTIGRGEVVGLIGPNGAGKTTLLECLAGLIPRDAGAVTGSPAFFVPDGISPWESQPAGWALRFFAALHGAQSETVATIIADLALDDLLHQPIGSLSRGQRKRVLVALGLVTRTPLLLLDEPFDGLDLQAGPRCRARRFGQHAVAGRTLFLSIHQLADAAHVCDRMVLLEQRARRSAPARSINCAKPPPFATPRSKRSSLRSPDRGWLLAKDARELLASRAYWFLLLAAGLLAGHAFLTGVDAYAEMSGAGGGPAALAAGLSPLDGVVVPLLDTLALAAMLLLPFVVIRLVAHEKQNGAWQLLVQGPAQLADLVSSKIVVLLAAWLVAAIPALVALMLWRAAGNHLDPSETFAVLLGQLLFAYGSRSQVVAAAAAAIMDGEANAAIVALGFTIGTWALEFAGTARGGFFAELAEFTPGAMLHEFEQGLVRAGSVMIATMLGIAGITIAAVWLAPGRRPSRRWTETIVIAAIAACLGLAAAQLRPSWDLSEDRRNSFAAADEAALRSIQQPLRIEIRLAEEDPRLEDFRRGVLEKLERLLPHIDVAYLARIAHGALRADWIHSTARSLIKSDRIASRAVRSSRADRS